MALTGSEAITLLASSSVRNSSSVMVFGLDPSAVRPIGHERDRSRRLQKPCDPVSNSAVVVVPVPGVVGRTIVEQHDGGHEFPPSWRIILIPVGPRVQAEDAAERGGFRLS